MMKMKGKKMREMEMKEEENDLVYCSYEQWNKCETNVVAD
jgi:hypothetical protein